MIKLSYICVDSSVQSLQFYVVENYLGDLKPGILGPSSYNSDFLYNFTKSINRRLIWTNPNNAAIQNIYII